MDQWSVLLDDIGGDGRGSDDPPEVKFNRVSREYLNRCRPPIGLLEFLARCTDRNSWQIDRADKIFTNELHGAC